MNKLPTEIIPNIQAKYWWKSLLIALFMLLILNILTIFYLIKYNPNKAYALIGQKWQLLFEKREKVDWLILGDSSGNQGIDAKQFEATKHGKALNLCTIADMLAVNDVWMLEQYIEHHGAPQNVLLIHTYDMWHRQNLPEGFMAQIPWSVSSQNLSLNHIALPNWKKIAMNALPLNYQRASIAWLIQHPQHLFQPTFHVDKNGFEAQDLSDVKEVLRDSEEHLIFVESNAFEVSKNNRDALQRIAEITQQHQINVYLANAPVYENLYQDEKFQAYYEKMQNFLTAFCKHKSWTYINVHPMTFSAEELQNVDHLTTAAAEYFTSYLITEIYGNEKKRVHQ